MNPSIKPTEEFLSFINFGGIMSKELRAETARVLFLHFYNPAFDAIDALEKSDISKRQPAWSNIIERLLWEEALRKLTLNNEKLAVRITGEVLTWFSEIYDEIYEEDEIAYQESRLKEFQENDHGLMESDWRDLVKDLMSVYPDLEQTWFFYDKKLREIYEEIMRQARGSDEKPGDSDELEIKLKAIKYNILKDWRRELSKKRDSILEERFDKEFPEFVFDLEEFYRLLRDFYAKLSSYFGFLGRFWDLADGIWQEINWNEFDKYAKILARQKGLRELTDILGRLQKSEADYDAEQLQNTAIKNEWRVKSAGKSEITGVRFSDDLSSLLPCEVALLSSPETEIIFSKKFVEKKLLTFNYRAQSKEDRKEKNENVKKELNKKGPIIACVDTSGSMHGTPEKIAKTIIFAILKNSLREQRKCFLISFSTRVMTLELSDIDKSLAKLTAFLKMSFHGGTDLAPAFLQALQMLKEEDFRNADVLLVSDFIAPSLSEEIKAQIRESQKRNKTRFHSLIITDKYNQRYAELFDHNWIYDPASPDAIKSLISNMRSI